MLKNYECVVDPQDAGAVAAELDKVKTFALDLETTGLDFNRSTIHGISLATPDREWYVCLGAEKAFLPMLKDLVQTRNVVGHNLLFDIHFLRRYGIDPPHIIDTMVGQFLVDENQELALKRLGKTKLGIRDALPSYKDLQHLGKRLTGKRLLEQVTIFDLPLDTLAEYAARDSRLTLDLWDITAYELEQEGFTRQFHEIEMPFLKVLLDMEETGFYIDPVRLDNIGAEMSQKSNETRAAWDALSGGVNPNSPKQLQEYLFNKMKYKSSRMTESQQLSTDIMTILRLLPEDKDGALHALVEFRRYEKLVGTYINPFQEKMYNGRLYGHFNQTGTVTGRLSSSDPSLQNIPARGETGSQIRELFAAPAGSKFMAIDYSQIELRLAAHYTRDAGLLKVFAEDGDPHQLTATLCSVERYVGKTLNFSSLYGAGPKKLQDTVEKSGKPRPDLKEATEWLEKFDQAYPTIANWKRRVIDKARELGYVKTIAGRKRRLADITSSDRALRGSAERQAVNSCIQGSAADIFKMALLGVHSYAHEYGAKILAPVHDEITFEVPEESVAEFGPRAQQTMEGIGRDFKLRVKLVAEPGVGRNWAEAKGH